jgi:carbon monoxide dehydrogenase subunit G
MTFDVRFDLAREREVKAGIDEVFGVLSHVPTSASFFPKVDRLVDLGDDTYRWELQKVGTQQVNIQTVYAAKYRSDAKRHSVTWTAVPGQGNAQVNGSWTLTRHKHSTHLLLKLNGEIVVPLPALTKLVMAPIVVRENEKLIDQYMANLARRFGGEV